MRQRPTQASQRRAQISHVIVGQLGGETSVSRELVPAASNTIPSSSFCDHVTDMLSSLTRCILRRRGAADADERSSLAEAAIGASIAAQGPEAVLTSVPLTVDPLHACDTWLLPILRKSIVGSELAFWGSYILPRARHVGTLAVAAAKAGKPAEHLKLAALELQLWNLLYSFANWARDLPVAMAAQGETLGLAFHNRPDLQACHPCSTPKIIFIIECSRIFERVCHFERVRLCTCRALVAATHTRACSPCNRAS